jgi:MFS family permease
MLTVAQVFAGFLAGAALLGVGTAMVYPTLLAAIGDVAHPAWRASAVGVNASNRGHAPSATSIAGGRKP